MEKKHLDVLINIDNKIDDVKNHIHSVELIQTRMESDLKYHIKRTDLLEDKLFEIDDKLRPVEKTKHAAIGIARLIAFLIAAIAAIGGLLRVLK